MVVAVVVVVRRWNLQNTIILSAPTAGHRQFRRPLFLSSSILALSLLCVCLGMVATTVAAAN